jgi:hypothetical protein
MPPKKTSKKVLRQRQVSRTPTGVVYSVSRPVSTEDTSRRRGRERGVTESVNQTPHQTPPNVREAAPPTVLESVVENEASEEESMTPESLLEILTQPDQQRFKILKPLENMKSEVWTSFGPIGLVTADTVKVTDYCVCTDCEGIVLKWRKDGRNLGTSNLKRHRDCCDGKEAFSKRQRLIEEFLLPINPPKTVKRLVTQACLNVCAMDSRPYNMFETDAMKTFCLTLLRIGRETKRDYAIDGGHGLLPVGTTVSRQVLQVHQLVQEHIGEIVKKILVVPCNAMAGAISADIWECRHPKRYFMGIVIHYIEDFKLIVRRISLAQFKHAHNAMNIERHFHAVLRDRYGIDPFSIKAVFTNDSESAVLAAFNGLRCQSHRLNTILKDTFIHQGSGIPNNIKCIFETAGKLVATLKRAQDVQLPYGLDVAIDVRWNSHCCMLRSILKNKEAITDYFRKLDDEDHLLLVEQLSQGIGNGSSWDYVKGLVDILEVIEGVIDILQSRDKPTLHLVCYFAAELPRMLREIRFQSHALQRALQPVIQELILNLEHKFKPDLLHKVAHFFHPLSKKRAGDLVGEEIKNAMIQIASSDPSLTSQGTHPMEVVDMSQIRLPSFYQEENQENAHVTVSIEQSVSREYDSYLKATFNFTKYCKFPKNKPHDAYLHFDILLFWKDLSTQYPILSSLACYVLAYPASSGECERSFSTGRVVGGLFRTGLSAESMEANIVIKGNPDISKKIQEENQEENIES